MFCLDPRPYIRFACLPLSSPCPASPPRSHWAADLPPPSRHTVSSPPDTLDLWLRSPSFPPESGVLETNPDRRSIHTISTQQCTSSIRSSACAIDSTFGSHEHQLVPLLPRINSVKWIETGRVLGQDPNPGDLPGYTPTGAPSPSTICMGCITIWMSQKMAQFAVTAKSWRMLEQPLVLTVATLFFTRTLI